MVTYGRFGGFGRFSFGIAFISFQWGFLYSGKLILYLLSVISSLEESSVDIAGLLIFLLQ